MRQEWSPEQICGRLKKERGLCISHEWIYQYVLRDKQTGGNLYRPLRCQKKRRKRYGTHDRRGKLPNCRSIEERPAVVNRRKRLGDWEADTITGKGHQPAIVTLTERKSRFTLLGKVSQRTAQAVQNQIQHLLLPVKDKVHTLTSDHGKEFANHEQIAKMLQLEFYFAHPSLCDYNGETTPANNLEYKAEEKKHVTGFKWQAKGRNAKHRGGRQSEAQAIYGSG